ncbi:hypothetical protein ACHAXA_008190 [Cyclostephanos tholiformis]|uniref:OTU domain-containing protein n=1 Tax=Cyclostephanos tholiformis TaxID=382380 RepID=A0ABD3SCB2_9STRA
MRPGLAAVYSSCAFIYPSALPPQHNACIDSCPPGISKTDAQGGRIYEHSSGPSLRKFVGMFRKRRLPRSNSSPTMLGLSLQNMIYFIRRIVLESSFVASASTLASIIFLGKVEIKFIIANVIRSMVASLVLKMCAVQSRMTWITSLEMNDWFCSGSYRILLGNDGNLSRDNFIPARIRQVPGYGSCLFQAIAVGVLFVPNDSADQEHVSGRRFPHISNAEATRYSSTLRAQAVKTLKDGIENHTLIGLQHGDTISVTSLVNMAASRYGMTFDEYLFEMRQENVWGGIPEIVALAHCLRRQIVMLETCPSYPGDNEICLKEIARFGKYSTSNPIYILSANQRFPMENGKLKKDHFLTVFPSRHLLSSVPFNTINE